MKNAVLPWSVRWHSSLVALAVLAMPAMARAQQATISGRVTTAGTGQPVPYGQVFVVGTTVAATTNSEGQYVLSNVPAGAVEVRVLRVGYQEQKKPITVTAGQHATLDFEMVAVAVQLQDVVTTATGQQRRVELGNSVATLGNISSRVAETPITSASDLLVAKAPGVTVLQGTTTGTAGIIHIRGTSSISLGNAPIWIVDGIRFNAGNSGFIQGTSGQQASFLNGLDPETIEDIEIVKGPSAATLYGTDAANGVIVVTTKKGRAGQTRWDFFAEGGLVQDRNHYADTYAIWGHTPADPGTQVRCILQTISTGACVQDSVTKLNILDTPGLTPLTTGHRQSYGMQVSGGTEALRFFVSGDYQSELGPIEMPQHDIDNFRSQGITVRDESIHPEQLQGLNVRANLNAALSPKFDLTLNTGFVRTKQRMTFADNSFFSLQYQSMMSPGFTQKGLGVTQLGSRGEELHGNNGYTYGDVMQQTSNEEIQRMLGSISASWRPFSWMQNDATIGMDLLDRRDFTLCRFNECMNQGTIRLGRATSTHGNHRNTTAQLTSNASWQAKKWLNLKTTVGAQYSNLEEDWTTASGQQLPPGAVTVGQAAVISNGANQLPTVDKTLGFYVQEQAAMNDKLFITVAARSDQNSAFGTNFQSIVYPKASVSWIMSDESFFPSFSWLNQFRLRGAKGATGGKPGATASFATYDAPSVSVPSSVGAASGTDTPGLAADDLGNPDLKPERSAEFEAGFDARLLSSRVNVEFTYYNKKTHDALINQAIAPSSGASATSVLRNLGSIQNSGVELLVNARVLDMDNFGMDVTVNGSHNKNEVLSLGMDALGNPNPTNGTGSQRDSVGLPINGLFYRPYTYEDLNGDGYITKDEVTVDPDFAYVGASIPATTGAVTLGFDLFNQKVRIQGMFDYKGGYKIYDGGRSFQCANSAACPGLSDPNASLEDQAAAVAATATPIKTTYGYVQDGAFWRFRDLSVTLRAPTRIANLAHAENASLSLGARNLHVWTKFRGTDPEENYGTADTQSLFASPAPRTYFTLRLNLHY
jgi:TonB-linked SusC/RagA family outer membrane protein